MQKTWLRSLQGLALLSAAVVLAGAKGQGCGGDSGSGSSGGGGPPVICNEGDVFTTICDGHGPNCDPNGCHDECVPTCDDGYEPIAACPKPAPCPEGKVCNEPFLPACNYSCNPLHCGPGTHVEEVCGGTNTVTGTATATPLNDDTTGGSPPNPGGPDCQLECVPNDVCPPGFDPEVICEGSGSGEGGGVFYPGGANPSGVNPGGPNQSCWTECVPESSSSSSTITSSSSSSEGGWQPF